MHFLKVFIFCLSISVASLAFALEPNEVMVIANGDIAESFELARYYCLKRDIPVTNVFILPLGRELEDTISRRDYDRLLAGPIRKRLGEAGYPGKIKCLVTTYGVPYKVGKRGQLEGLDAKLAELKKLIEEEKAALEKVKQSNSASSAEERKKIESKINNLQSGVDCILGKETNASVDSELSLVLYENYELYRWQVNNLKKGSSGVDVKTLMVSRLDGPGLHIARQLIDKAMRAEQNGLKGVAYVDTRGLADDGEKYSYGWFDQRLRELTTFLKEQGNFVVHEDTSSSVFVEGSCPDTALYCGWYSLKKYVDAFDFVDGAIGYHIASWEAVDLRDSQSRQWCPAMLQDGITATLGAVSEPYLLAFPLPKDFFAELLAGKSLVEAYYASKPFNSWQLILIGDPLYTPFKED